MHMPRLRSSVSVLSLGGLCSLPFMAVESCSGDTNFSTFYWQKRMKRGAGPQGNSVKAAGHPSSSWPFLSPECLPDRLPNAWQGHGNCSPKRCHDLLGCDTSLTCRFAGNQGYRKMSKLAAVVTQAIASGALRFRKCEPSHAPKQM